MEGELSYAIVFMIKHMADSLTVCVRGIEQTQYSLDSLYQLKVLVISYQKVKVISLINSFIPSFGHSVIDN